MIAALTLFLCAVAPEALVPDWDRVAPPASPTRLAVRGDEVVLGSESGLYARSERAPGGWALLLASERVSDLAVAGDELLVATSAGLYAGRGEPERVSLGAGDEARGVASDGSGNVWVATAAGLFRRARGAAAFERDTNGAPGELFAVATAGGEVWAAAENELRVGASDRPFAPRLTGLEDGWWQLRGALAVDGGTLLAVTAGLWWVDATGARRIEPGIGDVHGVALAGGRVFVAAERGLYAYDGAELERGAGHQLLSQPVLALAVNGVRLLAATERGIASFALGAPSSAPLTAPRGSPLPPERRESQVAALQRAVLVYLELEPSRLHQVESRARWMGLYPELRTSAGYDHQTQRDWNHDETFTSGELHRLFDRDHNRRHGYDAGVDLTWKFSEFVDPENALSVSRERRLVVSLRDQVLERVNHLYFQRLRLLGQLAALPPGDTAQRSELELGAAELAAQLDAWSGGFFTRLERDSLLESQKEP
jgi:hypothetical protein